MLLPASLRSSTNRSQNNAATVRSALVELNPNYQTSCVPLATQVANSLTTERLLATLSGFFGAKDVAEPALGARAKEDLLREKALVLRSIKELEFDRSMGKVSEADFAQLSAPLRARALSLMQAIEREPVPSHAAPAPSERPSAAREGLDFLFSFCSSEPP